jgi:hypothetical protein
MVGAHQTSVWKQKTCTADWQWQVVVGEVPEGDVAKGEQEVVL